MPPLFLFLSRIFSHSPGSPAKDEGGPEGVAQGVLRMREEPWRTKHLGRHACDGHVEAVQGHEDV